MLAERWLATSDQKVRPEKVDVLAAAIVECRWQPELHKFQPVKVAVNGKLRNGHHRLTAVVQTGIPTVMWVADRSVDAEG
jgi:hypothetical protein